MPKFYSLTVLLALLGMGAVNKITNVKTKTVIRVQDTTIVKNQPEDRYAELIDSLQNAIRVKMKEDKIIGASIALVDDQKILWSHGFGYTDSTRQHKVDDKTLFSLQSVTKTYTATAFLMQVNKKKISIDDPLKKQLPWFTINSRFGPQEINKITYRHLLSHWAGLAHEAPIGNNYTAYNCSFQDHVKSISQSWLRFPVGKFYSYSNLGIDIAGYTIAKKAGKSFQDFMKDELLSPLGMTTSTFKQAEAYNTGNLAKGYDENFEIPRMEIPMLAAGGLYANVVEMGKFVSFHLNGCKINGKQLISNNLLKEMYTPQYALKGQEAGYGLGVFERPFHGGRLIHHGGGGYGYNTEQAWIPEYKIGVVILTNDGNGSSLPQDISEKALCGMIKIKKGFLPADKPLKLIDKPEITLSETYLKKLTGTYKSYSNMAELKIVDGKLYMKRGSNNTLLTPHSNYEFTLPNGELFTFHFDKAGNPEYMFNLGDNGADFFIYNDSPDEKPGPNKSEWNKIMGTYKGHVYGEELPSKIFLKNGYLYSSRAGGTKLSEYKPGIYFLSDGESLIIKKDSMFLGSRPFVKQDEKGQ